MAVTDAVPRADAVYVAWQEAVKEGPATSVHGDPVNVPPGLENEIDPVGLAVPDGSVTTAVQTEDPAGGISFGVQVRAVDVVRPVTTIDLTERGWFGAVIICVQTPG